MMNGWKHWFFIRRYVPMGSTSKTKHIAIALGPCLDDMYLILVVDFNVKLSQTEGRDCEEDLLVMLAVDGIEYMATHF